MQYSKVCDFVKDDILRVGGKAVVRLSRLSRAPQSAEHAMVAAATKSNQSVLGGEQALVPRAFDASSLEVGMTHLVEPETVTP